MKNLEVKAAVKTVFTLTMTADMALWLMDLTRNPYPDMDDTPLRVELFQSLKESFDGVIANPVRS